MKTKVSLKVLNAINRLTCNNYVASDLSVFLHCEDDVSEYWGVLTYVRDIFFIVTRHGCKYSAYECKDHTHVKYMMMKMAF